MNIIQKFLDYKEDKKINQIIAKFEEHLARRKNYDKMDEIEAFLFFVESLSPDLLSKFQDKISSLLINLHRGNFHIVDFTEESSYYKSSLADNKGYSVKYQASKNYIYHLESLLIRNFDMNPVLFANNTATLIQNIKNFDLFLNFISRHPKMYYDTASKATSSLFDKMSKETIENKRSHNEYLSKLNVDFFNINKNCQLFLQQIQLEEENSSFFKFSRYINPDYFTHTDFVKNLINDIEKGKIIISNEKENSSINDNILFFLRLFLSAISSSNKSHEEFKKAFSVFEKNISVQNIEKFKYTYSFFSSDFNDEKNDPKKLCNFLQTVNREKADVISQAIINHKFFNLLPKTFPEKVDIESLEVLLNFTKNHTRKTEENINLLKTLYTLYEPSQLEKNNLFDHEHILKSILRTRVFVDYNKEQDSYEKFEIMLSKQLQFSEKHQNLMDYYFINFINGRQENELINIVDDYKKSYPLHELCERISIIKKDINIPIDIAIYIWKLFEEEDFCKFDEHLLSTIFKDSAHLYVSFKEKKTILGNIAPVPDDNQEPVSKRKRL